MGALQQQLGDLTGGIFHSGIVQLSLKLVGAYFIVLWLAAAFWAFRDMRSRTDRPELPYLAGALVILFSPLLFWLGLIVYRVLRPDERLAERRERELAELVLLAEMGEEEQCAGCHRKVEAEWMRCPTCATELREPCRSCGRLTEFDWVSCAWCGRDLGRRSPLTERNGHGRQREPVAVMDAAAAAGRGGRWSPPAPAAATTVEPAPAAEPSLARPTARG